MRELRFTPHARHQMQRRAISAEEVAEAFDAAESTYSSAERQDRLVVLGQTDAGRRLKIVLAGDDLVVTVAGRDEEG